tara:strand:+ start:283 stop:1722 length:1440 start_codon:yes stop_codon:yes gene_type:complete
MKVSLHNKDILTLIEQGFNDNEIRNKISKKHGIHLELSNINSKRKSELNDFIEPFLKDSKELLYPILYKGFPDRNSIRGKIDQIIYYLIDSIDTIKDFPSEKALEDLQTTIEKGLNTYKHDAFLYKLIYQHKNIYSKDFEDRREISILKSQLDDPFKHFFELCNMSMEHISFAEESADFDNIIREVCRDNIITKTERLYLGEKAKEYFIDSNKLKRYLDNPFFGYETFKIFIDQICEDGIVTEIERKYITEKSKQYNVPNAKMLEMISLGLANSSLFNKNINLKEFYDIILIYFLSYSFDIKNLTSNISEMFKLGKFNSEQEILFIKSYILEELKINLLNNYSINFDEFESVDQIFKKLNISYVEFKKALASYNINKNEPSKSTIEQQKLSFDTIQEEINISSLKIEDVEITKSNKLIRPFDVKFLGSKICIEYSDEIDEIILVKTLSVFYLKNSKTLSKVNLIKQINRILEQLLNEKN